MSPDRTLERHYTETIAACLRDEPVDHYGALRANDCAALHVGLDALARIQAKKLAAPPINPEWLGTEHKPLDREPMRHVTNGAVAILARHSQRVHDARTFLGDTKASTLATTVALVSVLR